MIVVTKKDLFTLQIHTSQQPAPFIKRHKKRHKIESQMIFFSVSQILSNTFDN